MSDVIDVMFNSFSARYGEDKAKLFMDGIDVIASLGVYTILEELTDVFDHTETDVEDYITETIAKYHDYALGTLGISLTENNIFTSTNILSVILYIDRFEDIDSICSILDSEESATVKLAEIVELMTLQDWSEVATLLNPVDDSILELLQSKIEAEDEEEVEVVQVPPERLERIAVYLAQADVPFTKLYVTNKFFSIGGNLNQLISFSNTHLNELLANRKYQELSREIYALVLISDADSESTLEITKDLIDLIIPETMIDEQVEAINDLTDYITKLDKELRDAQTRIPGDDTKDSSDKDETMAHTSV